MKKALLIKLLLLLASASLAQSWTTYTNMNTITEIVSVADKLYCANQGGVLIVNTTDKSIQKMTNTDGLGGISIESAALDTQNTLWFGSSNGKLSRYDLSTQKWRVYNQFIDQNGQKLGLLSIFPDGDKIWVGHSQGATLFDRDRNGGEIKENYQNFAGLISPVSVQAGFVWGNQIWIGTSAGVAFADKNDFNLLDPSRWVGINKNSGKGLANDFILSLALWNDTLWLGTKNGIYKFNSIDTSFSFSGLSGLEVRDVGDLSGVLYAATSAGVYTYSSGSWSPITSTGLSSTNLNSIVKDTLGNLWVGTQGKGMASFEDSAWQPLSVPGPPGNIFNDLFLDQAGKLWSCNYNFGGAVLEGQTWSVFDTFNTAFQAVAVDPLGQAWFATLGKGVLRNRNGSWRYYNNVTPVNCPLSPVCNSPSFVAVYGVSADEEGNLWFANRDACNGTSLVGFLAGTESTFVSFKENENINGTSLRSNSMPFCFAKEGVVWIGYIDAGLDALNYRFTLTDKRDDFVTNFPASNFAFALVASVAVDKTGIVWIGTSAGVYQYDPSTFQLIGVNVPPDFGPQVNSIAIDGRNNKWLGTSKGLVKLNPTGQFEEAFTTDNSYLADDFIIKALYDQKKGEFWIGTNNGLSRLSLPLTQPAEDLEQIFAYPNPFIIEMGTEVVSFARLPFQAKINIFTPTGEFIRELKTTDQWDGRNDDGKLVASGIYLFVVTAPGQKSSVGKIAVIRK
jgi:ligand-binding sensor domain-containing protein